MTCARCDGLGWVCAATGEPANGKCCGQSSTCPSSDGCPECAPQPNLLPKRIGVCPSEHANEFYMPLEAGDELTCPICPRTMAVYVLEAPAA